MSNGKFTGSVGYVGLGDMGGAIAQRLVYAAIDLIVFDLDDDAIARLVAKGARAAASLFDLVQNAGVVFICVDPEPAVETVIEEILEFVRPDQTLIIQSSVSPQVVIDASEKAKLKGVRLFDAPVSGTYRDRQNGTLAVPTGAAREDIGHIATLLELIGRPIYLKTVGGGEIAKLANNAVSSITRSGLMEAIELAEAYGVAEADLLEVLSVGSGSSFVVKNWSFFDDLARQGHIVRKQPMQAAEIRKTIKQKDLHLPIIEAHFEPLRILDIQRYKKLTGRYPDSGGV
ncbi:NAD(P)-dependent oxidoreductase [Sphingobium sp. CR2-8]|uniref:NAD(P)-dependent oxidoreductase n=1 Tax=Sphingobium sp. CR2-8 TaxID=1306534 RepID=UPI002DB71957|nr:NAD(P)-dependent oxidoreductase [Sphingobium sp. CR2-8]MEC3909611.1 NAD(P)-dependent oxidoreductase [Sphingobium sp. CR2-8]